MDDRLPDTPDDAERLDGSTWRRWLIGYAALVTLLLCLYTGARIAAPYLPDRRWATAISPASGDPAALEAIAGRILDSFEFARTRPIWQRWLAGYFVTGPQSTLNEVLRLYDTLPPTGFDWEALQTRALLLAEAQQWSRLERDLATLVDETPHVAYVKAIDYAYLQKPEAVPPAALQATLSELRVDWARDALLRRIAERQGDIVDIRAAEQRMRERGGRVFDSGFRVRAMEAGLVMGALLLGLGHRRMRTKTRPGMGIRVAPWDGVAAWAVLVSATALGEVTSTWISGRTGDEAEALALWAVTFCGVPVWLCARGLLRPHRMTLGSAFGLRGPAGPMVRRALLLLGICLVTSHLLDLLFAVFGTTGAWSDVADDTLRTGALGTVIVSVLYGVLVGPVTEEILYRGFLFTSLRRRFSPAAAAALAAVPFALPHYYSLSGLLGVAAFGVILALAYERYGSLTPGILCHVGFNALGYTAMILFYRA